MPVCDDCNGTNKRKLEQQEVWQKMTADEKIDLLLKRIEAIENQARHPWDGRIG